MGISSKISMNLSHYLFDVLIILTEKLKKHFLEDLDNMMVAKTLFKKPSKAFQ